MKHQRAIDDIEKNERRREILKAAAILFRNSSYDEMSMLEVAHSSGVAKGTLYLYFNTKEELFLALLDEAFEKWFADLQRHLGTLPAGRPTQQIAAFASSLAKSLQKHTLLIRLLPILHSVLEHNIPYPAALEFKRHLRAHLLGTGQKVEGCLAFLKAGQGAELLLNAYAGLIGLLSMTQPSEVAKRVLKLPEMALFTLDEATAPRQMVSRLLTGIYLENERKK